MATTASKGKAARTDPESGKSIPEGQLGDWMDEVPEDVQKAGDDYYKARQELAKATSKRDARKDQFIAAAREHGVEKVRIHVPGKPDKVLVVGKKDTINVEAISKHVEAEG